MGDLQLATPSRCVLLVRSSGHTSDGDHLAKGLRKAGFCVLEHFVAPHPSTEVFAELRNVIHHNLDPGSIVLLLDAEDTLSDSDWSVCLEHLLRTELVPRRIVLMPVCARSAALPAWLNEYLQSP